MADLRLAYLNDESDRQEAHLHLSETAQHDHVHHWNNDVDNVSLFHLVPELGSYTFPQLLFMSSPPVNAAAQRREEAVRLDRMSRTELIVEVEHLQSRIDVHEAHSQALSTANELEPLMERVEELEAELMRKKREIEVLLSASQLKSKTLEREHETRRQLRVMNEGLGAELDQVLLDKERVEKQMNEKKREWEDGRRALRDKNTRLRKQMSEKEQKWEDDRRALLDENTRLTKQMSEKEQKWEDDRWALRDENASLKKQLTKYSSSRAARQKSRADFDPGSVNVEQSADSGVCERKSEELLLPGGSARLSRQVNKEKSQSKTVSLKKRSDFDPEADDVESSAVGLTGGDSGVATGEKSLGTMEIRLSNGMEDIRGKFLDHFEKKMLESRIRELERKCRGWEKKCRDLEDPRLRDRQTCS